MQKIVAILGLVAALAIVGGLYRHHSAARSFRGEREALQISGPVKAIYIDYQGINWSAPAGTVKQAADAGFNLIILSFYLMAGPADMAIAWQGVSSEDQKDAVNYVHSKGGRVLISAGGATDAPYAQISGWDFGTKVAEWAVEHNLDGVDFDMENFDSPLVGGGLTANQTIQWLADASNAARQVLGNDSLITHAPQAPYFGQIGGGANYYTGTTGGYTAVYQKATTIDYFLVQFYNQGVSCYTDYEGLFLKSCSNFLGTSVKEIADYGIPLNKIVVGKPVGQGDANNGLVSADQLNQFFRQAQSELGWNAGVMGWVWKSPETGSWVNGIF